MTVAARANRDGTRIGLGGLQVRMRMGRQRYRTDVTGERMDGVERRGAGGTRPLNRHIPWTGRKWTRRGADHDLATCWTHDAFWGAELFPGHRYGNADPPARRIRWK